MTSRGSGRRVKGAGKHQLPTEVAAAIGHAAPALCCPLQWNKSFVLALTEENFLIRVNLWVCYQMILAVMWGDEPCTDMKKRYRISRESAAKSRTHTSWFSVHCPFSGSYRSLYAEMTQVWLKIYQYFRSLSDTSVLEISAYLQRVILVLHLYQKSGKNCLCVQINHQMGLLS